MLFECLSRGWDPGFCSRYGVGSSYLLVVIGVCTYCGKRQDRGISKCSFDMIAGPACVAHAMSGDRRDMSRTITWHQVLLFQSSSVVVILLRIRMVLYNMLRHYGVLLVLNVFGLVATA